MPDAAPPGSPIPESRTAAPKRRISLVWIVPIVAAVAGAWVAVTRILDEGPAITIVFDSAEGLEVGKTTIQYNGVVVGRVTKIRLSDDHERVVATAQMAPKADSFLVDDTQFWVVRPRISGASVTGLGTLISGAYVGMDIGDSKKSRRHFTALETPPVVTGDVPGRFFVLRTPDLGSLDDGTPIYFRRLQVGEVASYALDQDGRSLDVKVFVQAPYDQYVTAETRFWQASGIDVSLTANGLDIQTESVLSLLIGGIAFETPQAAPAGPPAAENASFTLYADRSEAFKAPAQDPQTYRLVFQQSVRGLTPGAPVEFLGIPIGEVAEIEAELDARTFTFSAPVTIHLDARRLGVKLEDLPPDTDLMTMHQTLIDNLVARGVRAQLRSGSLLTGSLYVAFDFFDDAAPAKVDWSQDPVTLPTQPGELEAIEAKLVGIVNEIDQMPLKEIGDDLRKTILELDRTLVSTRIAIDSANTLIEPNSVLATELDSTLQEVSRAARGIRGLADYLERHPEALLRGKTGDAE
jgi:paraquat-inducible protein B